MNSLLLWLIFSGEVSSSLLSDDDLGLVHVLWRKHLSWCSLFSCLKLGMVQQNSNTLPLRVNPKLQDASLPLFHALQTEVPVRISCGDELMLSPSPACWQGPHHEMLTGSVSFCLCRVGISIPVKPETLLLLQGWILCVLKVCRGWTCRKK